MKDTIKLLINEFHVKQIYESIERNIDIPTDVPLIISLIGARRCGKTFVLYNVIKKLLNEGVPKKNIVYLNFEDERLNISVENLDLILQSYFELYPDADISQCYFMFDEIQNIDGWEKFVRRIFDTQTKKIFITGSNSKLLSTEIATSLRGRTITFTVYPLSLEEYCRFRDVEIDFFDTQKKAKLVATTADFIKNGGFPEVVSFDNDVRRMVLQNYFNTMLYRDIIERYKVHDSVILKFFIKKVFAAIGKPVSINRIYNDIKSMNYKISNNYLYDYLDYCNTVFLSIAVPKFDFSEIKQTKSDKKIYSIDTGLLYSLDFSMSENYGKLLENMVLLEFIKAGNEVFYFKDSYECDFVIKNGNNLMPVQVCYTIEDEQTKEREIRGIIEVCKKIGTTEGLLITFDRKEKIEKDGFKIDVVPVYEYFLQSKV